MRIRFYNFCQEDAKDDAFGPSGIFPDNEKVIFYPKDITTVEDLLFLAGAFSSKSQARKNGFTGPIQKGYSQKDTGNLRYYIWNPKYTRQEWRDLEISKGLNPDE